MTSRSDATKSGGRWARVRAALAVLGLGGAVTAAPADAATSCVSPGGTGGCFASIQAAVDAAQSATLILVNAGTYTENVVMPRQRPIAIQGAGSATTIVDGGGSGPVISFAGERTRLTLSGVTLRNGYAPGFLDGAGIAGTASLKLTMSDVVVEDNDGAGISLPSRSRFVLTQSSVRGNRAGIVGDFQALTISDAALDDNTAIGLHASGGKLSVLRTSVSRNAGEGMRAQPSSSHGNYTRAADLTVTDSIVADNGSIAGAGIVFLGTQRTGKLRIERTTVSGNHATARGGGVSVSRGKVVIDASTIYGNSSPQGGGLAFEHTLKRTIEISRSTISGNTAGTGGGIVVAGSIGRHAVRIQSSTIAGNSATVRGGGIYVHPAILPQLVTASVIADNTSAGPGADCDGPLDSGGWLLLEDAAGCSLTSAAGDVLGVDPVLGPLQSNGGPTETQALLAGSPALGVVSSTAVCRVPDQRGVARTVPCDIGAYEAP